ncbi:MAG: glycosyltransferase [Sandaracinaceae bacterium]
MSKVQELDPHEWDELLSRDDFTVVSFYPNTVEWARETHGVELPYIEWPEAYDGWTGEDQNVLSIIHSYRERGWHYAQYREAVEGLPTLHVDHLDPDQPVFEYDDLLRALRRARLYLHDGEQEYTITLIEAMMVGLPLVSFRIPGIERYVVHGENGFVGETAAEIREHCQLLLHDDALAARMGQASREMALRDFHEERWRAQWKDAIASYLR